MKSNKTPTPSAEQVDNLSALLEENRRQRIQAVNDGIAAILQQYNCTLQPQVTLMGKEIHSTITIVPL
jgi:hypothetical protein